MLKEAAGAGYYNAKAIRRKYPRVQIRTIEGLLAGKKLDYYQNADVTFTKAERKTKRPGSTQNHCL